jgi:hypothetical protein
MEIFKNGKNSTMTKNVVQKSTKEFDLAFLIKFF